MQYRYLYVIYHMAREVGIVKQKPFKRTCCYWIVNNHNGAIKSCRVFCEVL